MTENILNHDFVFIRNESVDFSLRDQFTPRSNITQKNKLRLRFRSKQNLVQNVRRRVGCTNIFSELLVLAVAENLISILNNFELVLGTGAVFK